MGAPRRFGNYQLIEPIGAGGFGQVWRACPIGAPDGPEVAIKLLRVDTSQALATRLRVEAIAMKMASHAHVVSMLSLIEDGDRLGIVMELCRGSLATWLREYGSLPPRALVDLGRQVCAALGAAHDADILHHDIKPSNVLVARDGTLKLGDFGLASMLRTSNTTGDTSSVWGSLPFVSPERRFGRRGDRRSDIYSMGATLLAASEVGLQGDPYVERESKRIRRRLPAKLAEVILKACAADPEDRFSSAADFDEALLRAVETLPDRATEVSLPDYTQLTLDVDETRSLSAPEPSSSVDDSRRARGPLIAAWTTSAAAVATVAAAWIFTRGAPDQQNTGDEATPTAEPTTPDSEAASPPQELEPCADLVPTMRTVVRMGPVESMDGTAADLDGDGHTDMVFVNQGAGTLTIYWGAPGDPFHSSSTLGIGRSGRAPAVADFNEDGIADLVTVHPDLGELRVHLGSGARNFAAPMVLSQTPIVNAVGAQDWNGDGHVDLLMTSDITDFCTAIRHGDGTGSFAPHECIGPAVHGIRPFGSSPPAVYRVQGGVVERLRPREDGLLGASEELINLPAWGLPRGPDLLPADIDGDDLDELYFPRHDGIGQVVRIDLSTRPATVCVAAANFQGKPSEVTEVVDVDGDGALDVLSRSTCAGCTSNHTLHQGVRPVPDGSDLSDVP